MEISLSRDNDENILKMQDVNYTEETEDVMISFQDLQLF